MRVAPIIGYGGLAVVAVALDQWIKRLVEADMELHQQIDILPFFALFRAHNDGIAFSMFAWIGDKGLVVLALAVACFVGWLALKSRPEQVFARIGFALIIGGAIGNVIDRATLGYVIDYFLFHTPVWSFAIFNLADAFITVGAALVVLEEFLGWRRERAKAG